MKNKSVIKVQLFFVFNIPTTHWEEPQGCACFPEFLQNSSERQIW